MLFGGGATPLTVQTPTLPSAALGLRYRTLVTAIAGKPPYTFSVTTGALPAGLTLSPGGLLSGIPQNAGTFSFTVSVQDSGGHTAAEALNLTVNPTPNAAVWVSNGANRAINAFPLNSNGNVPPSATPTTAWMSSRRRTARTATSPRCRRSAAAAPA